MFKLPPVQIVLEKLLTQMGVDYDRVVIKASSISGHVTYEIEAIDHALLIGRDGQNLRAINYLVRRVLEERAPEGKRPPEDFLIDVGGYQARQIADLLTYTHKVSQEALSSDVSVELKPMSAFHRRVVHAYIANKYPNKLATESIGAGGERKIVLHKI